MWHLKQAWKALISHPDFKAEYFVIRTGTSCWLSFHRHRVAAGPAGDVEELLEEALDLNEYLAHEPEQVFCIRVSGDSMMGAGIQNNDLLVVNRVIPPTDGHVVVASVNGELTLKRLTHRGSQVVLMPENPLYDPIVIQPEMELKIWGVVLHVIHTLE